MGIEPSRVGYLAQSGLGPVADVDIVQRGEPWRAMYSPFRMLDGRTFGHFALRECSAGEELGVRS